MRILQTFHFRLPKKTADGVIFDSILRALETTGYQNRHIQFCLQNCAEKSSRQSSIARVLKCFPELERFQGSFQQVWDQDRVVFLANTEAGLHDRVAEPSTIKTGSRDPVDPGILSEILHGVPRRFPIWDVDIFFGGSEELNLAGLPANAFDERPHLRTITSPGIHFRSHWGPAKRRQNLGALISLPPPNDATPPVLPATTQNFLAAIGKIFHSELSLSPPAKDRTRIASLITQGQQIAKRYRENPFAGRPGVNLPCPLPPVPPGRQFGVPLIMRRDAGIPGIKELLKKEFGPLGYRYQSNLSGRGSYAMMKATAQNYVLDFNVDASPIGGQFGSSISLATPFARFNLAVKLPPHGQDYPINEHLPELVKNTAFVAQVLEETFVAEIATIFGPAPKWFATMKTKS
jgi:hypothetical protein